jgi:SagB-type dehydrogenase family enzyme
MSKEPISLYRPDMQKLKENDLPFSQVLEERRSLRQQGDRPLTLKQLGEFLYRTARVKEFFQAQGETLYECSHRPYPGGGACYELELYIAANNCQGLPFGLYHYGPRDHQLYKLNSRQDQVEALLDDAALSAGQQDRPQILIILAARFQRVSWKYESLAYALILKNVGVLYQTMYLVATALKLAPCALGGGNSDLFAAATGIDYYAESSVGEFILGSS